MSHKLTEVLGDDAGEELTDFLNRVDAERAGLRHVNDLYLSRLDARLDVRMAEAQAASEADLAALKVDVRADIARLRDDMNAKLSALREDMGRMEGRFEAILERRFSDLLKWSFMFWVGAVAAVALLAGVLR